MYHPRHAYPDHMGPLDQKFDIFLLHFDHEHPGQSSLYSGFLIYFNLRWLSIIWVDTFFSVQLSMITAM